MSLGSKKQIYRTSPLKRARRSRSQLDEICEAALGIINGEAGRITLRHLYYRLVSLKLIEKTESEYKALCDHAMKWRRAGRIPYSAFTDSTRYYRGARLVDSAQEALDNAAEMYRKNLWLEQAYYLEVWCEKDAIADVLTEAADEFGIPVFPCHGFASCSSLYSASLNFKHGISRGKKVCVLYFGDHDPSGLAIDATAQRSLALDHGVDVQFQRLAVLRHQIATFDLPTRPVKKSDSRSFDWEGGCVEIDALPMNELRRMVREGITARIDPHQWQQSKVIEALERETLEAYTQLFAEEGPEPDPTLE